MKKIILDAGHGANTPGKRTPKDIREWMMNDMVCRYIAGYMLEYDVEVLRCDDISGQSDKPLTDRTNTINYNNPDICISIHHNANTGVWGTWTGVETYSHPSKPKRDADLAKLLVDEMAKLTGLKNRGAKQADFHMIRETKSTIPSVLCEGGFMDSTIDEPVITSEKGQRAYAQAVANVCIAYLGLQKKAIQPQGTPIMGKSVLTAEQMSAFLLSKNIAPLLKCTPLELARLYITEANIEGVRGDIAFCQAIQETGWFKYGSDVLPDQNNYCGYGATNTTAKGKGAWFTSPQAGVRCHIQHLKAYGSKDALVNPLVQPVPPVENRFKYVTRGIAPNWQDLNGKWAVPGNGYGESILKIYADMTAFKTLSIFTSPHWAEEYWQYLNTNGVNIHEKRFDDTITRGEAFALLSRLHQNLKGGM